MSFPAIPSVFLILLALVSISPASGDDSPTAYEVLQEYDFPVGLLPQGVTSYELDRSTGEFKAYLNGSCSFTIEDYRLRYKSTISGVISTDKLSSLKGVSVKVLLFWVNIVEVTRDGDDLRFSVGIASADFGLSNFVESPQCGCGFDCNGIKIGEKKSYFNRFISFIY